MTTALLAFLSGILSGVAALLALYCAGFRPALFSLGVPNDYSRLRTCVHVSGCCMQGGVFVSVLLTLVIYLYL